MCSLSCCFFLFSSCFVVEGAVVQGRVGSRWYMGRVHSLNLDQTLDVAFDDNDFRPAMPSDRVQVLISHVNKTRYVEILKAGGGGGGSGGSEDLSARLLLLLRLLLLHGRL